MKKIIAGAITILLCFSLAACKNEEKKDQTDTAAKTYDVEVTVPTVLVGDDQIDAMIADAEKSGNSEVVRNGSDSVTFKLSQEEYDALMGAITDSANETVAGYIDNDDAPGIVDVSYADDFSSLEISVHADQATEDTSVAVLNMAYQAMYVQCFSGVKSTDLDIHVVLKDAQTGAEIMSRHYPKDLAQKSE